MGHTTVSTTMKYQHQNIDEVAEVATTTATSVIHLRSESGSHPLSLNSPVFVLDNAHWYQAGPARSLDAQLATHPFWDEDRWNEGKSLPDGFRYGSDNNTQWLKGKELQRMANEVK